MASRAWLAPFSLHTICNKLPRPYDAVHTRNQPAGTLGAKIQVRGYVHPSRHRRTENTIFTAGGTSSSHAHRALHNTHPLKRTYFHAMYAYVCHNTPSHQTKTTAEVSPIGRPPEIKGDQGSVVHGVADGVQDLEPAGHVVLLEHEGEGGVVAAHPLHRRLEVQEAPLLRAAAGRRAATRRLGLERQAQKQAGMVGANHVLRSMLLRKDKVKETSRQQRVDNLDIQHISLPSGRRERRKQQSPGIAAPTRRRNGRRRRGKHC